MYGEKPFHFYEENFGGGRSRRKKFDLKMGKTQTNKKSFYPDTGLPDFSLHNIPKWDKYTK
jgi:hypothetical protein